MIPCWRLFQLFQFPKLTWIMDDSEKKEIIITTPCEFNPRKWAVGAPPLPWQVPVPPWTALPPPMPYSTTPGSIILLRSPPHPTPPYHTILSYPYHTIFPPYHTHLTICHNLSQENPTTSLWWADARRSHAWSLNKYKYKSSSLGELNPMISNWGWNSFMPAQLLKCSAGCIYSSSVSLLKCSVSVLLAAFSHQSKFCRSRIRSPLDCIIQLNARQHCVFVFEHL